MFVVKHSLNLQGVWNLPTEKPLQHPPPPVFCGMFRCLQHSGAAVFASGWNCPRRWSRWITGRPTLRSAPGARKFSPSLWKYHQEACNSQARLDLSIWCGLRLATLVSKMIDKTYHVLLHRKNKCFHIWWKLFLYTYSILKKSSAAGCSYKTTSVRSTLNLTVVCTNFMRNVKKCLQPFKQPTFPLMKLNPGHSPIAALRATDAGSCSSNSRWACSGWDMMERIAASARWNSKCCFL